MTISYNDNNLIVLQGSGKREIRDASESRWVVKTGAEWISNVSPGSILF